MRTGGCVRQSYPSSRSLIIAVDPFEVVLAGWREEMGGDGWKGHSLSLTLSLALQRATSLGPASYRLGGIESACPLPPTPPPLLAKYLLYICKVAGCRPFPSQQSSVRWWGLGRGGGYRRPPIGPSLQSIPPPHVLPHRSSRLPAALI